MIATPLTKTVKIDPDQVQERNGLENVRVYAPDVPELLKQILTQAQLTNKFLRKATDG